MMNFFLQRVKLCSPLEPNCHQRPLTFRTDVSLGRPMKLAIVTDAWEPQVNGVVTTLGRPRRELERLGHNVTVIAPPDFRTIPCPTYPEIRLALLPGRKLAALL